MNTLIMLFFAGVFLSEVLLTMALNDSQIYVILHGFREPEYSSRFTGTLRNEIECVFECERMPTCKAVNFHTDDKVCELLEPGTSPLHPTASNEWKFYYTDSKHLYHFFNADASQKTTYRDAVAERGIDGNTDPNYYNGSCFVTGHNMESPWWMVDLFVNFRVERVIMWNRLDTGCPDEVCYIKLRDLTITVSPTLGAVDDPDNVCATYLGPPSPPSLNPVVVNCSRAMVGRYIKIAKLINEFRVIHLCEVDFA